MSKVVGCSPNSILSKATYDIIVISLQVRDDTIMPKAFDLDATNIFEARQTHPHRQKYFEDKQKKKKKKKDLARLHTVLA